jgi:HEPN domain-containing protein
MTPALEEAVRLLRLAHRDRSTLVLLARISEAPMASLGFHAQQAVEKALKAVSVSQCIEPRRTHDLAALAEMLLDVVGVSPVTLDELRQLNPFAVEYR